ncbi:MAG: hypothetical protein ACOX30_09365 [Dethiobacteria bacterium]
MIRSSTGVITLISGICPLGTALTRANSAKSGKLRILRVSLSLLEGELETLGGDGIDRLHDNDEPGRPPSSSSSTAR